MCGANYYKKWNVTNSLGLWVITENKKIKKNLRYQLRQGIRCISFICQFMEWVLLKMFIWIGYTETWIKSLSQWFLSFWQNLILIVAMDFFQSWHKPTKLDITDCFARHYLRQENPIKITVPLVKPFICRRKFYSHQSSWLDAQE